MRQLLYLHGFRSSPASIKAQQTAAEMRRRGYAKHFHCPALPNTPDGAIALLDELLTRLDPAGLTVVGSSLGGFFATWLAEKVACRAVLVNPAVRPYQHLANLLGEHENLYTGERFVVTAGHMDQLRALEPAQIHPDRYWLLAETADEVLNYREAVDYYAGCRQSIYEGGDHSFQRWEALLPSVLDEAGFPAPEPGHAA
ncbi:YqiA/YcfP family alpha/beta fold hydrolase [Chitinimonas sp. BJYL2]|uniref:YqiA/YcfP family alpha/beta fold hydrolase n=1 Tax=Chitinimonas sp. BJYL2 TaxID=2976696 RepID=UPI0022B3BC87|nr:YqiA/YcfP family alpha/beta fold hydrolase [Chitinimonas sp. BJYL2]